MLAATEVIHCDPEIPGGIPVFVGTRVPFRNFIDYLEASKVVTVSTSFWIHSQPYRASRLLERLKRPIRY